MKSTSGSYRARSRGLESRAEFEAAMQRRGYRRCAAVGLAGVVAGRSFDGGATGRRLGNGQPPKSCVRILGPEVAEVTESSQSREDSQADNQNDNQDDNQLFGDEIAGEGDDAWQAEKRG